MWTFTVRNCEWGTKISCNFSTFLPPENNIYKYVYCIRGGRLCYRGFHEKCTHSYLSPQGWIDSLHWTSVHSKYLLYETSCITTPLPSLLTPLTPTHCFKNTTLLCMISVFMVYICKKKSLNMNILWFGSRIK